MDEKQLCCLSIAHAGVFFVLFPFLSKVSMAAGFACLVFVAVSGACSIGPKTAIVHQVSAGPSQVVAMPFYNRCDRAVYALGAGSPWYALGAGVSWEGMCLQVLDVVACHAWRGMHDSVVA